MNVIQATKRMTKTMALADFVFNSADIKAEIEGALSETNKQITEKVKEIEARERGADRLHVTALKDRKAADAYVKEVSLGAERAAGDIRATALKKAESKLAPLVKREKILEAAEKRLGDMSAELTKRQDAVLKREIAAEKRAADAESVVADYTARIAKLERARALMDAAGA